MFIVAPKGSTNPAILGEMPNLVSAVAMLVGLLGSGKTSKAGKLAHMLREQGTKPYMVPAAIYCPAAIAALAWARSMPKPGPRCCL